MGQPANSSSLFDRVLKAFSGALLGSTFGLAIAASIDCAYARGGQFGARWLADLGLLAPVALCSAALWRARGCSFTTPKRRARSLLWPP